MTDSVRVIESEPSFACDLTVFEPGQLEEHTQNSKQLLATVQAIEELTDGYALELPVSTDRLISAGKFIALERLCCPWHSSTLELEPNSSSFWLRMSGPEGTKAVLAPALTEFIPEFFSKTKSTASL